MTEVMLMVKESMKVVNKSFPFAVLSMCPFMPKPTAQAGMQDMDIANLPKMFGISSKFLFV
eukprot:CAMPEP_0117052016 /NCGR_PEP_ID=MMETSP0472-20121206/35957_1 /TAXON_ID=693140 ORGANISM="Tiarina fusus, Strain LIS" /NCGR_SAMPLE_ID=MMETSP0472 /ASSEMBLY_ACC=CAM_ASM_000603 /LENGTH=60 /DNA_ID=CAMNT_0004766485 /DNA_START=613 /DNA_END=795 /DNA_ORIENTATION=+